MTGPLNGCAYTRRRTREIGLRAALGASPMRLLADAFSRGLVLVGSGIVAGNLVFTRLLILAADVAVADFTVPVAALMLAVRLLARVEPARRALRIDPTDALRET